MPTGPGSTGFQPVGSPLPHTNTFQDRAWRSPGIPKRDNGNQKKPPLITPGFFKNQEKPGSTGVPSVQAQVDNLCHRLNERCEPKTFHISRREN